MLMLRVSQELELYQTIEELAGRVARKVSPNVKLDNVQKLFFYFAGFMATVLIVFILNLVLFNRRQTIKLVRYLTVHFGESFLLKKRKRAARLNLANMNRWRDRSDGFFYSLKLQNIN